MPRTFGGNAGTNLNVWLFDNHVFLNGFAPSAAIFRGDYPLAIGFR